MSLQEYTMSRGEYQYTLEKLANADDTDAWIVTDKAVAVTNKVLWVWNKIKGFLGFEDRTQIVRVNYELLKILSYGERSHYHDDSYVEKILLKLTACPQVDSVVKKCISLIKTHNETALAQEINRYKESHKSELRPSFWSRITSKVTPESLKVASTFESQKELLSNLPQNLQQSQPAKPAADTPPPTPSTPQDIEDASPKPPKPPSGGDMPEIQQPEKEEPSVNIPLIADELSIAQNTPLPQSLPTAHIEPAFDVTHEQLEESLPTQNDFVETEEDITTQTPLIVELPTAQLTEPDLDVSEQRLEEKPQERDNQNDSADTEEDVTTQTPFLVESPSTPLAEPALDIPEKRLEEKPQERDNQNDSADTEEETSFQKPYIPTEEEIEAAYQNLEIESTHNLQIPEQSANKKPSSAPVVEETLPTPPKEESVAPKKPKQVPNADGTMMMERKRPPKQKEEQNETIMQQTTLDPEIEKAEWDLITLEKLTTDAERMMQEKKYKEAALTYGKALKIHEDPIIRQACKKALELYKASQIPLQETIATMQEPSFMTIEETTTHVSAPKPIVVPPLVVPSAPLIVSSPTIDAKKYLAEEKFSLARDAAKEAIALGDKSPETLAILAIALQAIGGEENEKQALAFFRNLFKTASSAVKEQIAPAYQKLCIGIGNKNIKDINETWVQRWKLKGYRENAIVAYREAYSARPNVAGEYMNRLIDVLVQNGDDIGAVTLYEELKDRFVNEKITINPKAYLHLARLNKDQMRIVNLEKLYILERTEENWQLLRDASIAACRFFAKIE